MNDGGVLVAILKALGFDPSLTVAGFWGALVRALMPPPGTFGEKIATVVVGTATATFLGGAAVKYTGLPELPTAFVVGLVGMLVCKKIIGFATTWRARSNGKNGHHRNVP